MQRVLEFLKRHYEKIVLGLVMGGLGWALYYSTQMARTQEESAPQVTPEPNTQVASMKPLDVGPLIATMSGVTNPPPLAISGDHNLFNPVVWRVMPGGDLKKILRTGAAALVVTNVTPLYERIGLDHVSSPGYYMFYQTESGNRRTEYMKVKDKSRSGLFILLGIKGAVDNPSQFELQFPDTQQTVWISADQPFEQVDGHIADMRYEPEALSLPKKRPGDTFTLDGSPFTVVSITNDAVTVQDQRTTQQTTIRAGAPQGGAPPP